MALEMSRDSNSSSGFVTHIGLLISQQVVSSDIQGLLGPQPSSRGSHSTKVSVYSSKSSIIIIYYCYYCYTFTDYSSKSPEPENQLMDNIKHQSWLKYLYYLSSDIALLQCVDTLLGDGKLLWDKFSIGCVIRFEIH